MVYIIIRRVSLDHASHVLNHDQTDRNTKPTEHWWVTQWIRMNRNDSFLDNLFYSIVSVYFE